MIDSSRPIAEPVRRSGAAGLMVLLLAGAAPLSCEHDVTIKGTVTVPVTVQSHFSAAMRGKLVMMASDVGSASVLNAQTIYTFCEPGTADLKLPFQLYSFGCVQEIYVDALVLPLSGSGAETSTSLPCGEVSAPPGRGDGTVPIGYARSLAFEGRKGGRCTSGTAVTDLAVVLNK
jgi:hypothetical protein